MPGGTPRGCCSASDINGSGAGPVSKRDAVQEVGSRGCCDVLSSEDASGAGDQTSGRIRKVGIYDTDSGRFGEGECVVAREDDVAAAAAGFAGARIFALAVALETVACGGCAAHDAAITVSEGACIIAMLVTSAGAGIGGARDFETAAGPV